MISGTNSSLVIARSVNQQILRLRSEQALQSQSEISRFRSEQRLPHLRLAMTSGVFLSVMKIRDVTHLSEVDHVSRLCLLRFSSLPAHFDKLLNDIEYNFNRPHQSFDYLAPRVYIDKEVTRIRSPVLPVWSASMRVRQHRGRASFRGIALSPYLP